MKNWKNSIRTKNDKSARTKESKIAGRDNRVSGNNKTVVNKTVVQKTERDSIGDK